MATMKIKNAVALVTGANRGLGLSFAKELLQRGAKKVYAAARDPSTVKLAGVVPVPLDVTRPESMAGFARDLGDVTLLINNAGIIRGQGALAPDAVALAREELETNYFGPLHLSAAFAPVLARNGGGTIVNVLSVLSWVTVGRTTTYSASKAAAWALTNGLRIDLAGQGTKVIGLHVGYIDTDMTRGLTVPKIQADEVARRGLDGVEAGHDEILIDDMSKQVKGALSSGVYLSDPSAPAQVRP